MLLVKACRVFLSTVCVSLFTVTSKIICGKVFCQLLVRHHVERDMYITYFEAWSMLIVGRLFAFSIHTLRNYTIKNWVCFWIEQKFTQMTTHVNLFDSLICNRLVNNILKVSYSLQNLPHLYNVLILLTSSGLKPFLWPICAFVFRVGSIVGFPFLLNEYFE